MPEIDLVVTTGFKGTKLVESSITVKTVALGFTGIVVVSLYSVTAAVRGPLKFISPSAMLTGAGGSESLLITSLYFIVVEFDFLELWVVSIGSCFITGVAVVPLVDKKYLIICVVCGVFGAAVLVAGLKL